MPGLDELEWKEYVDFTGGLWQRGDDRECAPNGLLESTDCFPLPSGGLKAFAQFQPVTVPFTAGDHPTTPAFPIGAWTSRNLMSGVVVSKRGVYVLVVENTATSPFGVRLLFIDSAQTLTVDDLTGASGTVWETVLVKTNVLTFSPSVRMVRFSAGEARNYFNFPYSETSAGVTQNGVWSAYGTTAILAFQTPLATTVGINTNLGPFGLWPYQNRLVFIHQHPGLQGPLNGVAWYTDAASTSVLSTANYISPTGEVDGVSFVHPFAPSDLMFMGEDTPFGSMQGAITAPTVREFAYGRHRSRGYPVATSIGLVMVLANQGAFAWDGESLTAISEQILGDAMGGPPGTEDDLDLATQCDLLGFPVAGASLSYYVTGQLGTWNHWIFFNNGYVLDARTGAWFTQTSAPGGRYWAPDPLGQLMLVSGNTSFQVNGLYQNRPFMHYSKMDEPNWIPSDTYSFTLPLIYNFGQKTNLSQVEYHVNAFNDSSTLEVELEAQDGQTITKGPYALANGPSQVRVNVGGHPAQWWKVRTILKSNRPGTAAPTLERMFCGTQVSTRYQESSVG